MIFLQSRVPSPFPHAPPCRLAGLKAELQDVDQKLGSMSGAAKEHKR